MPISDDNVRELLSRTQRIEEEQRRLLRTVYGDDEYPGLRVLVTETKRKTDLIDDKISGYEDRIKGAKWVIGGVAFLVSSGAVAALISFFTGG